MCAMKTAGLAAGTAEIEYPESDGKPMAETDLHRDEMFDLIAMLQARYADDRDVYVSGNLFVYYQEGNPRAVVAPDVFVVFGVPKGRRRIYKLWAEGMPPAVVIEVSSRKTRREDVRTKKALYAQLGVGEYYLFDPEADYLRPPLQGFRLIGGAYAPATADSSGALRSPRLGLDLRLEDGQLTLYHTATGARLLRPAEQAAQAQERAAQAQERAASAETRATSAETRAASAEAEVARLRAELDEFRGA